MHFNFFQLFIPFAASSFLTWFHHAFYVKPAQIKIKELSANQNDILAHLVVTGDNALLTKVDNVVGTEVTKLENKPA